MFIPTKIFGGTGLLQMSQIYGQSGLFRNTCAAFTGQVGWPHLFDAYILQHFTFSSHLGLITNHFDKATILTWTKIQVTIDTGTQRVPIHAQYR